MDSSGRFTHVVCFSFTHKRCESSIRVPWLYGYIGVCSTCGVCEGIDPHGSTVSGKIPQFRLASSPEFNRHPSTINMIDHRSILTGTAIHQHPCNPSSGTNKPTTHHYPSRFCSSQDVSVAMKILRTNAKRCKTDVFVDEPLNPSVASTCPVWPSSSEHQTWDVEVSNWFLSNAFREHDLDSTNSDHFTILKHFLPLPRHEATGHVTEAQNGCMSGPCDSGQLTLESDSDPHEVPLNRSAVSLGCIAKGRMKRSGGLEPPPLQIGGLEEFCEECSWGI